MTSKIAAGAIAGLAGGVLFGVMMQLMTAPTPEGGSMPMMAMVAQVVRSESLVIGWLYHLFNSALIGAAFGALFAPRLTSYSSGIGWGAAWGAIWWIVGALILMPILLGMPVFAALRMPPMRPVAFGSLVGHLVYGIVLGAAFVRLYAHTPTFSRPQAHAA